MIHAPERSPERDAVIDALLVHVPFDGWTTRGLAHALAEAGQHAEDAALLFPGLLSLGGAGELVEAFCDLADRRMAEDAAAMSASQAGAETRLSARVRAVIALRLARARPHKEAVRRALAVLALPQNARIATACMARSIDAIWYAAGDQSTDFSWYTKRASLGAIYAATLLYWLRDTSPDDAATLAFLDRRLADLGRIGQLRGQMEAVLGRFIPPQFRPASP